MLAAAKSLQSCPTLCDPRDSSSPGSPIPGILQARTLEWIAISFSNEGKWKVKVKSLSRVRLLVTPWTAAYQASPSMWFSRQEYWSGVPLLSLYICLAYIYMYILHIYICILYMHNNTWLHIIYTILNIMQWSYTLIGIILKISLWFKTNQNKHFRSTYLWPLLSLKWS